MGYLLRALVIVIVLSHVTCQDTSCYESVDILFIVDASGSVGSSDFQKQLQFASTFINKFRFGPARFSVLRFDTSPNITVNFGDYQDVTSLKNAIAKIPYVGGGTDTAAALKLAREQAFLAGRGARAGVPRVAIVSTDGLSNNPSETKEEAKRLRDSGVLVLSIGVGTEYNKAELEAIATYSVDIYEVIDYNMLLSIVNDYSELVCTVVKLFQCNNEADIFFLLDSSSQIDQVSFQNQLTFVKNVSNSLKLTRNKFGVVTFGASVRPVFKLRQFNASNELALALSAASPAQGVADVDQVLKYVRDQDIFNSSVGDRDNATKILVLVTNGDSSSSSQAKVTANQLRQSGINLLAVGVSSPNLTQLQELVNHPVLDVVTNLANSAVAANRIETLIALTQCTLPQFGGNQESEYCRIYNWENGIHPHPKDCTKFIECTFLRTDVMRCPPDLAYDPDLQTCTYKTQVTACFGSGGVVTPPGGNVTQPPDSSCQDIQLADIILVLDSSNSISPPDYLSQLTFVASITEEFNLGPQQVRFGAVTFSTDTVKLFDLKDYSIHDTLKSAILSAPHLKTGTDTARALNFVYDQNMFGPAAGGRDNATKILIVMTDGRSNSMEDTVSAALKLKSSGVRVLAIGIGEDIYLEELQQIASDKENLFTVPGFQALDQIKGQVTSQTCLKPCVKGQLDILLIIDSSDTVGVTTYGAELRLAANLAENFHLGPNDVQFGALTFGSSPHPLFSFNRHWDYTGLQTEILRAPFLGGSTQTHLAFQSSLNLFDASHGSRPGAPRLAILLTNGRSSDPVQTERQATALKQAGVHVIVVGFVGANLPHLQNIASGPTEVFYNDFNGVLAAIRDFSSYTCTVGICRGLQLADVLFLLDSSNSITSPDYRSQLQFVANLTAGFTVGPDHVRFGGVIYSTDTVKLFDLKDHDDLTTLGSAILSAPHLKTGTDTARALNFVYDQNMFGPAAGGRDNATKILIVMTDGRSNSMEDTLAASLRLKSSGVKVLAIGIGSEIYLEELVQLASDNQSLFTVSGFDKLNESLQTEVTKQTCDNLKNPENIPDVSLLCSTFHWADGEHPNPYDCSTYVRCTSLVTSVVHCPVGQAYDPRLPRCTDRAMAHPCNDSSYFGPTATPAPARPTTTGRPSFVITDICNIYKLADGIYPDPGNCDHFVECTAFLTQYLQCPAGLNYNTVNQVCDDVHVIDCQVNYHFYDRFITG